VLLQLGHQVLQDQQGRLRWVESDLRDPSWPEQLGEDQVDAVLSTTALRSLRGPKPERRSAPGTSRLEKRGGIGGRRCKPNPAWRPSLRSASAASSIA